jgi:hypothetical protein
VLGLVQQQLILFFLEDHMKALKVISLFAIISLSGCASMDGYSNASILGGMGAILGSALTQNNPAIGMALGGGAGYYYGRSMDQRQSAIGTTDCGYSANKTGTDHNGNYSQSARSAKRVAGYKQDCN